MSSLEAFLHFVTLKGIHGIWEAFDAITQFCFVDRKVGKASGISTSRVIERLCKLMLLGDRGRIKVDIM